MAGRPPVLVCMVMSLRVVKVNVGVKLEAYAGVTL